MVTVSATSGLDSRCFGGRASGLDVDLCRSDRWPHDPKMAGGTPWCPSSLSSCLVFITSFDCISPCASLVFVDSVGWYRLHLCRVLCFHFVCGNTTAQVLVS